MDIDHTHPVPGATKLTALAVLATALLLVAGLCTAAFAWFSPAPQPHETALAAKAGLFVRMEQAGIVSIKRRRESLHITLRDGSTATADVCAWNSDVDMQGTCGRLTNGSGRSYTLRRGESPAYLGDPHRPDDSTEYVLSWLDGDLVQAEHTAAKARETKARDLVAAATWTKQ